jgi:uncharacterized protein DUF2154
MNKHKPLTLFLILVFLSLMVTACKPKFVIGPEQTFEVEVPRSETGSTATLTLDLAVPQGKLALAGGTEGFIQGAITYNAAEYKPQMMNSDGALLISQTEPGPKSVVVSVQNNLINQWDLQVGDLPMNFEIRLSNGEYTVDFAQSLPADFKATIDAGVGKVNLILDPNMVTQVIIGEHTDLLKVTTRGDWTQTGDVYQTGANSAALTITVNMRGGELHLDNK